MPNLPATSLICCVFLSPIFVGTGEPEADAGTEISVIADVAYRLDKKADEKKHRLDLYLPRDKKNFPVLIFVHGGGYQKGDRKEAEEFGKTFAKRGVGVAAISYRRYPQVKHPSHIQDVASAFRLSHPTPFALPQPPAANQAAERLRRMRPADLL